jgi:hypothetical protein
MLAMPDKTQPIVTTETITPELARHLLEGNTRNRKPIPKKVQELANAIISGHWLVTHQGIAVAPDGTLLDGQHRLMAIAKAGIAVKMMICRNLPPESFDAIDRGTTRRMRDVLSEDQRIVDACTFIAKLHLRTTPQPHHIRHVIDDCGPAVLALLEAAGSAKKIRTAAPIKAAAALRLRMGNENYVLGQWRAWVNLDTPDMSPAIGAFLRQISNEKRSEGGSLQMDRACRAWVAFDINKQSITKIQITDAAGLQQEMRAAWLPNW